jgi:hypothetical protein
MNKDKNKRERKLEKHKEVKSAIKVLLASLEAGLIEIPKYEARDIQENELYEDVLMEELYFITRNARKDTRNKRIRLFFVGVFFIVGDVGKAMKKQYKECSKACRYLLKHKKEVRQYMSVVKLGIMDPKSSWLNPVYRSGDNVAQRLRPDGMVESRIHGTGIFNNPIYQSTPQTNFYRKRRNSKRRNSKIRYSEEQEKSFLADGVGVLETVAEEMSKETTGPFKGEAEFRNTFKRMVDKQVQLQFDIITRNLSGMAKTKWVSMSNRAMYEAWKRRLECTENSKNSSKPEGDDSQS